MLLQKKKKGKIKKAEKKGKNMIIAVNSELKQCLLGTPFIFWQMMQLTLTSMMK